MKRSIVKIILVVLMLSPCFCLGQSMQLVLNENEVLLSKIESLLAQTDALDNYNDIEPAFTDSLTLRLIAIKERAIGRAQILKQDAKRAEKGDFKKYRGNTKGILSKQIASAATALNNELQFCAAVDRVLSMANMFTRNKKAYFAHGKYLIPANVRPVAQRVYNPIFDSLSAVVQDFPHLEFEGVIKTIGYSDNVPTPKWSTLYKDVAARLQRRHLSNDEINRHLSYLRAQDISQLLVEMKDKRAELALVQFDVVKEAKGTEQPEMNTDYANDDERRRLVKVYWHILPKF